MRYITPPFSPVPRLSTIRLMQPNEFFKIILELNETFAMKLMRLTVAEILLAVHGMAQTGEKVSLDDETSADSGKAAAGSAPTGGTDDLLDLGADPGAVISDKPKPAVRAAVVSQLSD